MNLTAGCAKVANAANERLDAALTEAVAWWEKEHGFPSPAEYSSCANEFLYRAESAYCEAMMRAFVRPLPTLAALRPIIFERDGFHCLRCFSTADLTLDHIVPRSEDGADDPENLQTLCRSCNSSKGTKTIDYRIAA